MKETTKMSRAVGQLEKIYNTLNADLFGGALPVPIITVQSKPGTYGHCTTSIIPNIGSTKTATTGIRMITEWTRSLNYIPSSSRGIYNLRRLSGITEFDKSRRKSVIRNISISTSTIQSRKPVILIPRQRRFFFCGRCSLIKICLQHLCRSQAKSDGRNRVNDCISLNKRRYKD